MRFLSVSAVILATSVLAAPAVAQDALGRYEAASEAIGEKMNALLAAELPKIANNLPETDWDDAHREAGTCVLQTLVDEAGIDYVANMLAALEVAAKTDYASTAELSTATSLPGSDKIGANRVQLITEECGLTALSMQRMMDAGTFEAMQ